MPSKIQSRVKNVPEGLLNLRPAGSPHQPTHVFCHKSWQSSFSMSHLILFPPIAHTCFVFSSWSVFYLIFRSIISVSISTAVYCLSCSFHFSAQEPFFRHTWIFQAYYKCIYKLWPEHLHHGLKWDCNFAYSLIFLMCLKSKLSSFPLPVINFVSFILGSSSPEDYIGATNLFHFPQKHSWATGICITLGDLNCFDRLKQTPGISYETLVLTLFFSEEKWIQLGRGNYVFQSKL